MKYSSESKYEPNESKWNDILRDFSQFSQESIYSTHIKIAANCYAAYINEMRDKGIRVLALSKEQGKSLVLLDGENYIVNTDFVTKCIIRARTHRKFWQVFGNFMFANIILDELRTALLNRK